MLILRFSALIVSVPYWEWDALENIHPRRQECFIILINYIIPNVLLQNVSFDTNCDVVLSAMVHLFHIEPNHKLMLWCYNKSPTANTAIIYGFFHCDNRTEVKREVSAEWHGIDLDT